VRRSLILFNILRPAFPSTEECRPYSKPAPSRKSDKSHLSQTYHGTPRASKLYAPYRNAINGCRSKPATMGSVFSDLNPMFDVPQTAIVGVIPT
jgi:hypothetical protein